MYFSWQTLGGGPNLTLRNQAFDDNTSSKIYENLEWEVDTMQSAVHIVLSIFRRVPLPGAPLCHFIPRGHPALLK
jgi:hypothetical protein